MDFRLVVLGGVGGVFPAGSSTAEEAMRTVEEVGLELVSVDVLCDVRATISDDKSAVTVVNELVEEEVDEVGVSGSCSTCSDASSCFVEGEVERDSPPVSIFSEGGVVISPGEDCT